MKSISKGLFLVVCTGAVHSGMMAQVPLLLSDSDNKPAQPIVQVIERKRWYDERLTLGVTGSMLNMVGTSGANFGTAFQTNLQVTYLVRDLRYFAISGLAELSYVNIGRAKSADLSNGLEVYAGTVGASLGRQFPRFTRFSGHLNLAFGLAYSLLLRGQDNALFNSRNLIINPSVEVRYKAIDSLYVSLRGGYAHILYAGSDFMAYQIGIGAIYAF